MAFVGAFEDRLAIRELLDSYVDALFRRDEAAWARCWTEDAVWHFGTAELQGRVAIVAAWRASMAPFTLAAFVVQPGEILVDGDTAKARSYTRELLTMVGGGSRHIVGRYQDDLVRTGEGWRFAVRRYTLLHEETPSPAPRG